MGEPHDEARDEARDEDGRHRHEVAREPRAEVDSDAIPRTWADAEERTREFEALLEQYDGDFQKATDAQLRGERADPGRVRGSRNPM